MSAKTFTNTCSFDLLARQQDKVIFQYLKIPIWCNFSKYKFYMPYHSDLVKLLAAILGRVVLNQTIKISLVLFVAVKK